MSQIKGKTKVKEVEKIDGVPQNNLRENINYDNYIKTKKTTTVSLVHQLSRKQSDL